jgi:hypothetical protein
VPGVCFEEGNKTKQKEAKEEQNTFDLDFQLRLELIPQHQAL